MRNEDSFTRLLSALQHPQPGPSSTQPAAGNFANPFASAALPIPGDAAADPGVADLWDHASAWAPAPEAAEPQETAAPRQGIEGIARELGLTQSSTPDQIHRARRRFMWKYHPDRRPEMSNEWANQRVAVANMLIDRALEAALRRNSPP